MPEPHLELIKGETEKAITDPIADLKKAMTEAEGLEIMEALVKDRILTRQTISGRHFYRPSHHPAVLAYRELLARLKQGKTRD